MEQCLLSYFNTFFFGKAKNSFISCVRKVFERVCITITGIGNSIFDIHTVQRHNTEAPFNATFVPK